MCLSAWRNPILHGGAEIVWGKPRERNVSPKLERPKSYDLMEEA
jgi:hypothetical protein